MSDSLAIARRMLQRTGSHPVISLFLDLDPAQFATAPARASQARSLLDEAERIGKHDALPHDDQAALRADLERLDEYLASDDLPVSGARSLAVFCSRQDDLFETVALPEALEPRVVIAPTPYVEPLVAGVAAGRWCVTLISRRNGAIFAGDVPGLEEEEQVADDVRGRPHRGGLSQANYQRGVDDDAERHLRHVAEDLYRLWQSESFHRLVLGGSEIDVDQFREVIHNDLRPLLSDARLGLEPETATVAEVRAALVPLLAQERAATQTAAVSALTERVDRGARAAVGIEPTLDALAQRRVERLVLAVGFAAQGGRCLSCGLLYAAGTETCPVDGSALEPVADLREAAVEAAVLQDAGVVIVGEGSEIPPSVLVRGAGIAALLRF
ncbi:MAG TPA: Vms1/Ankzf1 family peptidyl-tRNA hydrolase [Solirubrobacteraceae bacterium]|jgi:peptide subunit release factor 1 (eRF1)|nr:Vms1/Ankzf1 family peptidyl-tRNA hydrolase [Solirubrobacteraceae bacterium]